MRPSFFCQLRQHVEPNVESYGNTSNVHLNKPHANPTYDNLKVDIHVFNTYVNKILDESNEFEDLGNENPQNKEANIHSKINEDGDEDDNTLIANIMKRIVEEKADQKPSLMVLKILAKSLTDKAKGKEHKVDTSNPTINILKLKTPRAIPLKKKKDIPSKTHLVKKITPQRSPVSKRRRFDEKNEEKKSLKRKLVQSNIPNKNGGSLTLDKKL
ncbi:unnamed protein product [Vicia faba]|uniref:Uncharacterized protein n=1 Tax=Vicia faba TaxID=3906 RepID=A0AAV1AUE5_VICFA|nr:unnamed protein product [Vicia faba]